MSSTAQRHGHLLTHLWNIYFTHVPSRRFRKFLLRRMLGSFGEGSSMLMHVHLMNPAGIFIGKHCVVNPHCILDGRGCPLEIQDCVDIATHTHIWTAEHNPNSDDHATVCAKTVIEEHAWIASRVTILPGVRIGRGTVVACGAVVTKDTPPMSIVGGVPAKVISQRKSQLKYTPNFSPWLR